MRIQGKVVNLGAEQINVINALPDADMKSYKVNGYEPRSWIVDKLCPNR